MNTRPLPPSTGARRRPRLQAMALLLVLLALPALGSAQPDSTVPPPSPTDVAQPPPAAPADPMLQLGPGDAISIKVFGRPELDTTAYISDDGTVPVPLAGSVEVGGLSPAQASARVADALRHGQFLIDPQVTVFLVEFRSQQVSVLGQVQAPGRFPIDSRVSVFDLIAQAGGTTEDGADTIYLLRPNEDGTVQRHAVNLRALTQGDALQAPPAVQGGDSIFVPRAGQFYIHGEVQAPNMYRLEPGMTVVQALSRGGGVTQRGSSNRVEIRRRNADGQFVTLRPELTDLVQADDVILIKERIF